MIDINLIEFVIRCKKANVTPCEKEIDAYLNSIGKHELRERFVRFCFYNWEKVSDNRFMEDIVRMYDNYDYFMVILQNIIDIFNETNE